MHVHTAERIEPLAARLAEVLTPAPVDPMTPEWIAVPSVAMRRWLSLELARHLGTGGPDRIDGIAANIEWGFPGSLRLRLLESGRPDGQPDPWRVERLVWAVLEVAGQRPDDPLLTALTTPPPGASRYSRARRIAQLFDRYHVHRPDLIRAWAAGHDLDGSSARIADHHAWQPHLWRLVRERLASPSPPERLPTVLPALRADATVIDLPQRLAIFGLSVLPGGPEFLDLAAAIGERREVHLFLLEPSATASAAFRAVAPSPSGQPRIRSGDDTALAGHPLLRSWGRLHAETATLVGDAERAGVLSAREVDDAVAEADTLLARLHADIRSNRAPAGNHLVGDRDRSVQFHACHGPARQVEVLRDAILHLLADDATLGEDDIVVVCPALERFAPLIEAVFGPSADAARSERPDRSKAPPALRYRISDRSVAASNPVLTATRALLELAASRFEAPAVLDLVASPPVRERFGFTESDVALITDWVHEANIRWGLDSSHRKDHGLPPEITNNTWRAGLDRILLGAAVGGDDLSLAIGEVAPLGIEGDQTSTAGRLADLLWRLTELAEQTDAVRPVDQWVAILRDTTDALFAAPRGEGWQTETLHRQLADVLDGATIDGAVSGAGLSFVDVRRLLNHQFDAATGRPDFFRGGVTITSVTPLRWIPHRVVCLLGMDQPALGSGLADGDDLAALAPRLGDRDARGEVRQALLESILSARDTVVLLRDGHDVRTNQAIPPAVAVAELRDALAAMVLPVEREGFLERLEVQHPRQPFDERCFTEGTPVSGRPWSFDPGALDGAQHRRTRAASIPAFVDGPLPSRPEDEGPFELAALHAFLKDPVKCFFDRRLGVRLPRREEGLTPLLPVEPDGLELYTIGGRLLDALVSGSTSEEWERVETRLGTLPPGVLGGSKIERMSKEVGLLLEAADGLGVRRGPGEVVAVDITLPDGTRITGTVLDRLGPPAPGPACITFTRAKSHHHVAAWLDLMALVAADPVTDWRSVAINRCKDSGNKKMPPVIHELVPSAPPADRQASAIDALGVVVDLYRRGLREPLPMFSELSRAVFDGTARRDGWTSSQGRGEGDKPAAALVFGGHDLRSLLELPAEPHDPPGPERRMARFARLLFDTVEGSVTDRSGDDACDEAADGAGDDLDLQLDGAGS